MRFYSVFLTIFEIFKEKPRTISETSHSLKKNNSESKLYSENQDMFYSIDANVKQFTEFFLIIFPFFKEMNIKNLRENLLNYNYSEKYKEKNEFFPTSRSKRSSSNENSSELHEKTEIKSIEVTTAANILRNNQKTTVFLNKII